MSKSHVKFNKEELSQLVQTKTLKEIAEDFDVCYGTVSKWCHKFNIKFYRSRANHNFFKTWSHDMAYVLGFLTADGNVHSKKPYLTVELQREDEDFLREMLRFLHPSAKVYRYSHFDKRTHKTYESSKFSIHSPEIVDDLAKYNVIPNKTGKHRLDFDIPRLYQPDYIRGFFDGDGSVYIKKGVINTSFACQSLGFLEDLHCILGLGKIRDGKPPQLTLYAYQSMELKQYMYNGNFCLKRKKVIFDNAKIPTSNRKPNE